MFPKWVAIVVLLALVLAGGCRAPAAPVVTVAATAATVGPDGGSAPPPVAPTPSVTPTAAAPATPRPSPTAVPPPATPTPSPTPRSLAIHEWEAAPVLFRYDDNVCGDFCVGEVFSPLPRLILYADGRLISVPHWTQMPRWEIEQTQLSRQEVCALLNTFDIIGLLDYDSAAFEAANNALPRSRTAAELEVNAWAAAAVDLGGLDDFLPGGSLAGKVALDRPLLMTYELVERLKQMAGEEPYMPPEMVVGLQRLVFVGPEDAQQDDGKQWLPTTPWVSELQAEARENTITGPALAAVTTVTGSDVTALLAMLDGKLQPRPVGDRLDGQTVVVYFRSLFPYESAAGIGDPMARPQIPGPDVAYESQRLRCTPEDGVVDFYDELVAATDVRLGLFHPPPAPTVPQPNDRKESDQP